MENASAMLWRNDDNDNDEVRADTQHHVLSLPSLDGFFGRPYAISIHHPVRKTIYIYLARRYLARWQEILASLNKPLPL